MVDFDAYAFETLQAIRRPASLLKFCCLTHQKAHELRLETVQDKLRKEFLMPLQHRPKRGVSDGLKLRKITFRWRIAIWRRLPLEELSPISSESRDDLVE